MKWPNIKRNVSEIVGSLNRSMCWVAWFQCIYIYVEYIVFFNRNDGCEINFPESFKVPGFEGSKRVSWSFKIFKFHGFGWISGWVFLLIFWFGFQVPGSLTFFEHYCKILSHIFLDYLIYKQKLRLSQISNQKFEAILATSVKEMSFGISKGGSRSFQSRFWIIFWCISWGGAERSGVMANTFQL